MFIAVLRFRLAIPAGDLKQKRMVVRSVVARLRGRFNAAVAEIGDLDLASSAALAAVCVSKDAAHADAQVQAILAHVRAERLDAELLDVETELIPC
jgi:uncharacterized protein YlxP (DUF503 family)